MQPPDGPPVWTALTFLPPAPPLPISNTIVLRDVPSGTSTRPTRSTFPTSEKTLVPELPFAPIRAYQSLPLLMITGTLHQVSTLLRSVGYPKSPPPISVSLGGRG